MLGLVFLFVLSNQLNKNVDPCEDLYSYLLVLNVVICKTFFSSSHFRQFQVEFYKHA